MSMANKNEFPEIGQSFYKIDLDKVEVVEYIRISRDEANKYNGAYAPQEGTYYYKRADGEPISDFGGFWILAEKKYFHQENYMNRNDAVKRLIDILKQNITKLESILNDNARSE